MRAESLHAIVLLALVAGLAASAFAGYETLNPSSEKICSINPFVSCAKIDNSGHTTTFGVPDWILGVAGYVALLALDVGVYRTWRRDLLLGLTALSGLGVAFSAYLAYIELVVIVGLCPVCLTAYLANALAFGALIALVRQGRSAPDPEPGPSPSA